MVARKLEKRLFRSEHIHERRMDKKYLNATTRQTLLALLPLCFGYRLGMDPMVVASREVENVSTLTPAKHAKIPTTAWHESRAVHCWWIFFLSVHLVMVILLVQNPYGEGHPKKQKGGWRLQTVLAAGRQVHGQVADANVVCFRPMAVGSLQGLTDCEIAGVRTMKMP